MPDYVQIEFENLPSQQIEIVVALLSEMNYEGFEEQGDLLKAFIPEPEFCENSLNELASAQQVTFTITSIRDVNWNEQWESSFKPVLIHKHNSSKTFVGIRAQFHAPLDHAEHEIIITPKMSFGTGHHATTSMMIMMMGEVDFEGKTVLDFGTGTGVLAIAADKLGASKVIAIDYDDHSIANAIENFSANDCQGIILKQADSAKTGQKFDIILSNIIRQVILANLSTFIAELIPGGTLILSGLLPDDEDEVLKVASACELELKKKIKVDNWICLQMIYKPV